VRISLDGIDARIYKMFQAALRPQALKCSVARTLQASEEARVTAAAKLFPGIKRLSERVLVQGLGSRVWDADGNELIDFASGIGVTSTGHCHPKVVEAVREQAGLASHLQMSVTHHDRALQLIERLEPYALGLDRFFFATSGAEAVEGALRLARQATGRAGVVAFRGGYHGRTAGTLAITTSGIGYRGGNAGPLPYGAFFAPYPGLGGDEEYCRGQLDLLVKQQVAPSEVAAVILEPVLGEGLCGNQPSRHRAAAVTGTTLRRWRGRSTPSSRRRHKDNVASMAWDARNLISTQARAASSRRPIPS